MQIEKLIKSVDWQFAKTMPEIPHEYIVTDLYPEKSEEINTFIAEIDKNGYKKSFYGKKYKYLKIYGYKYWVIENIINRTKIKE
ncbi:MAG TPA: hypothetical protein VJJ80_01015 [Patescibacteria group bacterium]|nr:hypothetical protein [Patescibacteria group bacterium]